MSKAKIIYTTMGIGLAATTTAAIAVPIAVTKIATKKATNLLSKVVPLGGPENSLADRLQDTQYKPAGKLRYVAIGDSVTAGYNGYMHSNDAIAVKDEHGKVIEDFTSKDYLSYADFIASDLEKANMLYDYRNFSVTGDTIPNARQNIFRNTSALSALRKADVISLSLGANDLLAAVEVLKLSFNGVRGEADTDKVVQYNAARDAIDRITKVNAAPAEGEPQETTGSPSGYPNEAYTKHAIRDSFDELVAALKNGNLAGLLDIEQDLLSKVFDLIQLDFATFINEVHQAAPQAKIVVMGYAFPFHLLPKSLTEVLIPDTDKGTNKEPNPNYGQPKTVDGKQVTLTDVFLHLISTLKDTVSRANYVKFFDINELKEFSKDSDQVTYTLLADGEEAAKTVTRPEWDRVMPNPLDIHPSTYGHQVIAGHLYEWMLQDMKSNKFIPYKSIQKTELNLSTDEVKKLEEIYTYLDHDARFETMDEFASFDSTMMRSILQGLDKAPVLKALGQILSSYADGNALGEAFSQLQKLINGGDFNLEDIKKVLAIIPNINNSIDTTKLDAEWPTIEATFKDDSKSMTDKLVALGNKLPAIMKLAPGVTAPTGLRLPSSFDTWKDLRDSVDFISFVVSNLTAPKLTIGNEGHSVSEYLNRLKELIDKISTSPIINLDPWMDGSKQKPADSIQTVFMALMSDGFIEGVGGEYNISGIKLVETLFGTLIYLGTDEIDKTNDQTYPIIKAIGGLFVGALDWNSKTIKDMLPMVGGIIQGGSDYEDEATKTYHSIHDDKISKHQFEADGVTRKIVRDKNDAPKHEYTDPDTHQLVQVYDFNDFYATVEDGKIAKTYPESITTIDHYDQNVPSWVFAENVVVPNDDFSSADKFLDHIFEQAKLAGLNLDTYRAKMLSSREFLMQLADGANSPDGKSLIQKWVENIGK